MRSGALVPFAITLMAAACGGAVEPDETAPAHADAAARSTNGEDAARDAAPDASTADEGLESLDAAMDPPAEAFVEVADAAITSFAPLPRCSANATRTVFVDEDLSNMVAHGEHLYTIDWGGPDALVRRAIADGSATTLLSEWELELQVLAADDERVYFAYDEGGWGGYSLATIPVSGGAKTVLAHFKGPVGPIELRDGYVWCGCGDAPGSVLGRVATSGGAVETIYANTDPGDPSGPLQLGASAIAVDDTRVYWGTGLPFSSGPYPTSFTARYGLFSVLRTGGVRDDHFVVGPVTIGSQGPPVFHPVHTNGQWICASDYSPYDGTSALLCSMDQGAHWTKLLGGGDVNAFEFVLDDRYAYVFVYLSTAPEPQMFFVRFELGTWSACRVADVGVDVNELTQSDGALYWRGYGASSGWRVTAIDK